MPVTIKDIARMAGVSTATVSKVLSRRDPHISQATRQRVLDLAKQHSYRPSALARTLVTRRSRMIGIVVPDILNPYFAQFVRACDNEARARGYSTIVCNSDDDPKREREQIEFLASQRAEGIILSAGSVVPDIDFLRSLGTHIACIDREIEAAEWMSATIVTDYRGGAFAAAQHLIARGHRRIAFLGGAREHFNVRERMAGFELAHREIGIAVDPELVACGSFQHGFGLESTRRLLRQTTFSAICCMSDILAMGACAALREIGKSVPDDCAVIGFDNTFLAPLLQQPLSSVDRRLEESAHLAIAAIVGSIENPDLVCQRHMLHTAVVARQTT